MTELTYNPEIFETPDMATAKRIILTPEPGSTTESRWVTETPYLAALLGGAMEIRPGQVVIDYGCGVGRMSKALIEKYDCLVIGVDISRSMRALAPNYVQSSAFSAVSRRVLQAMVQRGFRADAAISVWVLQHCAKPAEDLGLIVSATTPGGALGLVNSFGRYIPTKEKLWADDGVDVRELVNAAAPRIADGVLDASIVGDVVARHGFWSVHRTAITQEAIG